MKRILTFLLAAALLLGALALFGAWSLWDIAATRRAADDLKKQEG